MLSLDNVVLTPHLGASTEEAQTAVSLRSPKPSQPSCRRGVGSRRDQRASCPGRAGQQARPYSGLARASAASLLNSRRRHSALEVTSWPHRRSRRRVPSRRRPCRRARRSLGHSQRGQRRSPRQRQGIAISESPFAGRCSDYVSLIELRTKTARARPASAEPYSAKSSRASSRSTTMTSKQCRRV